MKHLITISLVAGAALFVPSVVPPIFAHEKPLPPAFGKELVPDEATQERNEDKAAEIEEENEPQKKHFRVQASPRELRGKALHIELDGDEDGGGIDDEGGDDAD